MPYQRALAHRRGFEPGLPDYKTTALPTELSRLLWILGVCKARLNISQYINEEPLMCEIEIDSPIQGLPSMAPTKSTFYEHVLYFPPIHTSFRPEINDAKRIYRNVV